MGLGVAAAGFAGGLGGSLLSGAGQKKRQGKQNKMLRKAAAQIPGMDAFRSLEQPIANQIGSRVGGFSFAPDTNQAVSNITSRATPFSFNLSEAGPLRSAVTSSALSGLSDFNMPFDASRRRVREDALATAIKEGRTGGPLMQAVTDAVAGFEENLIPMQEQIRQGRVGQASGILSSLTDQILREQAGAEGITGNRLEAARAAGMGRDLATEQANVGRLTQALVALGLPIDAARARANILAGQQAPINNMEIFGNALSSAAGNFGLMSALGGMGGGAGGGAR